MKKYLKRNKKLKQIRIEIEGKNNQLIAILVAN